MSTRATYRIAESINGYDCILPRTYYIHYDGYPSGASDYFIQLTDFMKEYLNQLNSLFGDDSGMILRCYKKKRFSSFFEMGIPFCEETIDHDSHGDTEYQYNLFRSEEGEIFVTMKSLYGREPEFNDTMVKFIKKYSKGR